MTRKERIEEVLNGLSTEDIVSAWNEYQQANNYEDELIPMYELDDYFCGCTVTEFLGKIDMDEFDLNDDYFRYTIYGIASVSDVFDVIYIDELAQYMDDNEEYFDVYEIEEIFEEEEEEEEEEE